MASQFVEKIMFKFEQRQLFTMSLSLIISHYENLDTLASHVAIPAAPRTGGAVSSLTGRPRSRRFVQCLVTNLSKSNIQNYEEFWVSQQLHQKTTVLDRKHVH